jgi:hypothetical protein
MKGPEMVGVKETVGVLVGGTSVAVKDGVIVGGIGEGVMVFVGVGVSDAKTAREVGSVPSPIIQKIIAAAPAMIRIAAILNIIVGIF